MTSSLRTLSMFSVSAALLLGLGAARAGTLTEAARVNPALFASSVFVKGASGGTNSAKANQVY